MRLSIEKKSFGDKQILGAIELSVRADETLVLFGPSGCGKSTILKIIMGLDDDYRGRINGQGPNVGAVFQEPFLLNWLSVRKNLELVCSDQQRIEDVARSVGVYDCLDQFSSTLSLGMARRVAFARALVIRPDLLVMDEPFVSLDHKRSLELRTMVLDLQEYHPHKGIFVTHDLSEAVQLGHRILFLGGTPCVIQKEVEVPLSLAERRVPHLVQKFIEQI